MADIVLSTIKKVGTIADTNLAALEATMRKLERILIERLTEMTVTKSVDVALARAQIEQMMVDAGVYERIGTLLNDDYQKVLELSYKQYKTMYPELFKQFSGDTLERLSVLKQLDFADMNGLTSQLADSITRGIIDYQYGVASRKTLLEGISAEVGGATKHLKTQFDTSLSGYYQQVGNFTAEENGLTQFEYKGPHDDLTRDFCRDLLDSGRTYSQEEIDSMDNGQDLSVFQFGGGWNCRHFWVAVA